MGRKRSEDDIKADSKAAPPAGNTEDEVEDTPLVKELKDLDDKYLVLEREYEKEKHELRLKYEAKQQPLLESRTKILITVPSDGEGAETGTPALSGFWLTALRNHPCFEDIIEEWDEPVLEFIRDITRNDNDEQDPNAGFTLTFEFAPNPYFTNGTLVKEYETEEDSPYTGDLKVKAVKATEIDWKPGKDVTIEKVSKKVKGGGANKSKQKGKDKEEPRESFFRLFFRSLTEGQELPDDVDFEALGADADEDEEDLLSFLMDNDHEGGLAIKESIIPFAVRWYTGEAAPEGDDDDDESEEEEDDDDDSEEDPPPRKGSGTGKKKGGKIGKSPKSSPDMKPKDPKEECKQQ